MQVFQGLRGVAEDALRDASSDRRSRAAFLLLLLFAAVGPFLYGPSPEQLRQAVGGGDVTPSGTTLISLLAFLIASLTLSSGSPLASLRPLRVPLSAVVALALLGAAQLLPLPDRVLGTIAPVNTQIYHETNEVLGLFGRPAPLPRISIAPTETASAVLLLAANAALFLSAFTLLRNRARRRLLAGVLLGSALAQVVLASALEDPGGRVHGAFRNADHFAGYLEIALAVAFGAVWAEVLTNRDRAGEAAEKAERFERRFAPMAGRVLLWGLIAAGIALTQSRGGILAAGTTTLVLLAAAVIRRRSRAHGRAALMTAIGLLVGVLLAGRAVGAGRFYRFLEADPRDLGTDARMILWKTSLQAWREFPIVGSGLGTFREAFRRVQPRELQVLVEHAHNDFLQLAVTGGVVGATIGVLLFVSLFVGLVRAWIRQTHREESALVLAGFGALLSLTLHGLVEFNLSIPVIPATLACVLGAAWAAGRRN